MFEVQPVLPWPGLLLLWGIAVVTGLRWYRQRYLAKKSGAWRRLAAALRLLVWCLLLGLALRPSYSTISRTQEKSRVLLVTDQSDSMEIRDMPGPRTRHEAVALAWQRSAAAREALNQVFDVEEFVVGRSLLPAAQAAQVRRSATALGDALSDIATQRQASPVHCVVLISDGINNTGRSHIDGALALAQRGTVVHTVLVGQSMIEGDYVDAIMMDLACPPAVEKGKQLAFFVEGLFRGLGGRECRIEVRVDERKMLSRTYLPTQNEENYYEQLELTADFDRGFHLLTVELVPPTGEISPHNNQLSTYFKVRDGDIQVLLLEPLIRPEYKFLRRLLSSHEDLSLTTRSPFWLRTAAGVEYLSELNVYDYDVVLLGDLPFTTLSPRVWRSLRDIVRNRGAGVMIIGGSENLHPTFLRDNPLADCLPYYVVRDSREVLPFRLSRPAEHFVTGDLEAADWGKVQMLGLRQPELQHTPQSQVVLADAQHRPLLVVDSCGRGRVAVLATDCTWNWQTDDNIPGDLYASIWTRLVYWLASREDGLTANLSIAADRSRYRAGEQVVVTGDLVDAGHRRVATAEIELTAVALDGSERRSTAVFGYEGDRYVARFALADAGNYSLQATTSLAGAELLSNELRVSVFATRVEDRQVVANEKVTAEIAEHTGGRFLRLEDLESLWQELPRTGKVITVTRRESSLPLWDKGWLLAAILSLLTAEWAMRRRGGLP